MLTKRQFVQSLSNPYYLHHLCVQKYFDNDAFLEWCKYLKYFSEPQYLPYLSYVPRCLVLVEKPYLCIVNLIGYQGTLVPR